MNGCPICPLIIVIKRRPVRVFASHIDLAGSDPIHDHFRNILIRHRHRSHSTGQCLHAVIDPVFVMMFIPALMVQPGAGITDIFSFRIVGAACPLIVFCPYPELCGTILGHIMQQSLFIQTYLKAALCHKDLMMCDRFKMFPDIHFVLSSFSGSICFLF